MRHTFHECPPPLHEMVRHRRFSNVWFSNVWFSNPRAAGKISGTDVEHEWAYSNREMRRFLDKYVGCDTALKKRRIVTPSVCHCIFASETTCSGIGNTEHVCQCVLDRLVSLSAVCRHAGSAEPTSSPSLTTAFASGSCSLAGAGATVASCGATGTGRNASWATPRGDMSESCCYIVIQIL